MKSLHFLGNILGALLIAFTMWVIYNGQIYKSNVADQYRQQYIIDSASAYAFSTALSGDDLGIDYVDLNSAKVSAKGVLDSFNSVLCMSSNIAITERSLNQMSQNILFGVLLVNNGYYVLELTEDVDDEYIYRWSLKYPYIYKDTVAGNNRAFSFSLNTDVGVVIIQNGNDLEIYETADIFSIAPGVVTKQTRQDAIVNNVNKHINYQLKLRNDVFKDSAGVDKAVHIPHLLTKTGVNTIDKTMLMMGVSGGTSSIFTKDVSSVGSNAVTPKKMYVGFVRNGRRYYISNDKLVGMGISAERFFTTENDAVSAGYRPYIPYLAD